MPDPTNIPSQQTPTPKNGSVNPIETVVAVSKASSTTAPSRRGRGTTVGTIPPVISDEAARVLAHNRVKQASMVRGPATTNGRTNRMAAVQVVRAAPKVFSPLYENSNLQLPRDLRTLNAWNRHFYNINPLVRNGINLHATYPISKFNLQCEDQRVLHFFEDMFEQLGMSNILHSVSLEYWKLGEAIPHAELDANNGVWQHIFLHNPDYIRVQISPLAKDPIITLIPDEHLKRVVTSSSATDAELKRQLPHEIVALIQSGLDIPLNNFNVSHLKMLSSDYDVRGSSIITACYKDLMLYDKLREAEFVQADDMVNPITHVKLGDPNGAWKPDDTDISDMRQAFEEAMYDLDFKLVTHGAVSIEKIGNGGAVLDTSRMWDQINKNILIGLMTPEEIINGNGASYASATVGLEVLRSRYERFRTTIETWMRRKIMEPISKIQDFYKWEHGRRRLIVPQIIWNKMNLRDVESYIQNLVGLVGEEPGMGRISGRALLSLLDIDPDTQVVETRRELIDAAVRAKEQKALSKMSLEELLSLNPNKPVTDRHPEASPRAEQAMPGETDGGGGEGGGGGLGDLGLGGGGPPPSGPDLGDLGLGDLGGPGGAEGPSEGAPTPDLGGPGG
jgi:hypothetical protein